PSKLAFPLSLFKSPSRPDTSNAGRYYDPANNTWTSSPNMNVVRSFVSGAAIGNNLIIAAGGFNGSTTVASTETESIGGGCASPTPTATATPTVFGTPSATPTCTPIVVIGSIDTGDPTQTDRLFRSGVPQTCPPTTTCAIFGDPTPRHYDSYTFTNTTGSQQCVTIDTNTACTGTNF